MRKEEIARWFNCSAGHIDKLVRDGMPREKVGRHYDYGAPAVLWYFTEGPGARSVDPSSNGNQKVPLDEARARRELAQAELAEYELAQKRAGVLTVDVHLSLFLDYLNRIRARLLAFPGKWAPRMVNLRSVGQAQARAEQIVDDALLELTQIAQDLELDGDYDAPERPKKRPARRRKGRSRKTRSTTKTKRR